MTPAAPVRLTAFTSTGGCAAKFGPVDLQRILSSVKFAGAQDPGVLVGLDTGDDAGVYQLTETMALVQTADFIGPVCDDPYTFGQIAAANALSDVYAMGGKPLTALNLCCFPASGLPPEQIAAILNGGLDKISEAGATLLGGHTVADPQIKYGLSVTGVVRPDRCITNAGAKPGDLLVLGKPLGAGVMVGAARNDQMPVGELDVVLRNMTLLNKAACDAMLEADAHACTDVTGFGLAGHGLGMARASQVGLRIRAASLPVYSKALELLRNGLQTSLSRHNRELAAPYISLQAGSSELEALLYDPQTSGGLLIAVPEKRAERLASDLRSRGYASAAIIGEVFASPTPSIEVLPA